MASAPALFLRKRHIAATIAGNALEFYDFTTYAYFAVQIGATFFPSHDHFFSLMAALITFGAGFIMRPIGGIVIGRYADRIGRKPAMLLSFALMGAGVVAIAVTPSYASIGIAAPIIVVIVRLVQGFALGGDVGPTTAILMEAAPPNRRGLYGALQYSSQGLATLLAGIAGVVLASVLDAQQLQSFGWRIAFGLGALVVPIGFFMRRQLPETLHSEPHNDLPVHQDKPRRSLAYIGITGLGMIVGATVGFYVLAYMSTYAQTVLHMKANVSFAATLLFGAVNIVFSALGGLASDKWGRRSVMIWPRVVFIAATYPAFLLIVARPDAVTLLTATGVLAVLSQFGGAAALVALAEAIPKHMRSTMLAAIYALGVAVFGGTTQGAITWLMHVTGDIYAPAYYLTAANIVCLIAMLLMDETAPVAIRHAQTAIPSADLGV
ncbi:MAG TPA: MFS transporter [Rhizomicrobium sp.]|nr:MFS transporter [Rhizomicrobium sp.]